MKGATPCSSTSNCKKWEYCAKRSGQTNGRCRTKLYWKCHKSWQCGTGLCHNVDGVKRCVKKLNWACKHDWHCQSRECTTRVGVSGKRCRHQQDQWCKWNHHCIDPLECSNIRKGQEPAGVCKKKLNAVCTNPAECAGGACIRRGYYGSKKCVHKALYHCDINDNCESEICYTVPETGARECRSGYGDSCSSSSDCEAERTCKNGRCRGLLFEECNSNGGCSEGFQCQDGKCLLGVLGVCESNDQCADRHERSCHDGKCRLKPLEWCENSEQCMFGECQNRKCRGAIGDSCTEDEGCLQNYCKDDTKTCEVWPQPTSCSTDSDCASEPDHICSDGQCLKGVLASCTRQRECAKNHFCTREKCRVGLKERCLSDEECNWNHCNSHSRRCRITPNSGPCTDEYDCLDYNFKRYECQSVSKLCKLKLNERCRGDYDCSSKNCFFRGGYKRCEA